MYCLYENKTKLVGIAKSLEGAKKLYQYIIEVEKKENISIKKEI